jgi:hypothetical protein
MTTIIREIVEIRALSQSLRGISRKLKPPVHAPTVQKCQQALLSVAGAAIDRNCWSGVDPRGLEP